MGRKGKYSAEEKLRIVSELFKAYNVLSAEDIVSITETDWNRNNATTSGLRFYLEFYPSFGWMYGTGTLSYFSM